MNSQNKLLMTMFLAVAFYTGRGDCEVKKNPMLKAALAYFDRGILCVPQKAGKLKPTERWTSKLKKGEINKKQIIHWFKTTSYKNLAIMLKASKLAVLDVDSIRQLGEVERQHSKLPKTHKVKTPHGYHCYFKAPPGGIKDGSLPEYPKLEIKYRTVVTAPPSPGYKVSQDLPIVAMPAWLIKLAKASKIPTKEKSIIYTGERNNALTRIAGSLRGQQGFSEGVIREVLAAVNTTACEKPLSDESIIKIAHSISRYAPEDTKAQKHTRLMYQRLSQIEEKEIEFIWEGRVFQGKPTLIAGPGECGKTHLTTFMAAVYTNKKKTQWPDGTPCGTGEVIILSAEDDAADTLLPRINAMGGDPDKIFVIQGIKEGKGQFKWFDIRKHVRALEKHFNAYSNIGLLVVDPITSYLGGSDASKNEAVREAMGPITQLIAKYRSAGVFVTHFNKDITKQSVHRVISSVAWVNLARAVHYVMKDPEDDERRLFLPGKMNIGKKPHGLAFKILQTGDKPTEVNLHFESAPVLLEADDIIIPIKEGRPPTRRMEAENFLEDLLSKGPVRVKKIEAKAEKEGLKWSTVLRASRRLGIKKDEKYNTHDEKSYWVWFF